MLRPSRCKTANPDDPRPSNSPLVRLLAAGNITRIEVAARSGVNLRAIKALADDGEAAFRLPISTLARVAVALGCAPAELIPALVRRPRSGLLFDRGVFRRKRTSN